MQGSARSCTSRQPRREPSGARSARNALSSAALLASRWSCVIVRGILTEKRNVARHGRRPPFERRGAMRAIESGIDLDRGQHLAHSARGGTRPRESGAARGEECSILRSRCRSSRARRNSMCPTNAFCRITPVSRIRRPLAVSTARPDSHACRRPRRCGAGSRTPS